MGGGGREEVGGHIPGVAVEGCDPARKLGTGPQVMGGAGGGRGGGFGVQGMEERLEGREDVKIFCM